jgi:signal transduction histidine kinase/ActR/RegA family two-component response regulator
LKLKRILLVTCTTLLVCGFGLAASQWIVASLQSNRVRVGYSNSPPYAIRNSQGQPEGLVVDVLRTAARRAGIQLEWNFSPDSMDVSLRRGDIDLWSQANVTPERAAEFHATPPWLSNDYWLVWIGEDSRLPKLDGKVIAVRPLPHLERLARRAFPGAKIDPHYDAGPALRKLCRAAGLDALIVPHNILLRDLSHWPAECSGKPLRSALAPHGHVPIALFARKGLEVPADALRHEIGALALSGDLSGYFRTWGVPESDETRLNEVVSKIRTRQYLMAACVTLLLALLVSAVQLNRDLRVARQDAEKANVAKSAFLANMSHEIRTPLNGVLGMNSLLLASNLPAEQREWSRAVQTSGQSLLAVLNDILDLAKIEAGSFQLEPAPFCLHDTLADCARLFRAQARLKNLQLDLDTAPELPRWVLGDAIRIRQIVSNYLSNAIKFTEQGAILLGAQVTATGQIRISVRDTGPGLSPDQQAKLFQRFVQADESTTRRYGGTGLGLAICRELSMRMGGATGVVSHPGQGAEFWVELPLPITAVPQHAPQPNEDMCPLTGLRVLVAEDNLVNQKVVGNWLRKFGCTFEIVANGQLALDALRRADYDMVLMDCHMPVLDGYQALSAIRQSPDLAATPVVALTANAMAGEREKGLALGFDDYLSKPVEPKQLWSALARYRTAAA